MGACCGNNDPNSKYIDQKMKQNEEYERLLNKLLFLGPGGSGKSTIFKQLQWLHGDGFSDSDIMDLKQHINGQICSQMRDAIKYYLCEPTTDEKLNDAIATVKAFDEINPAEIPKEISSNIVYIYKNDPRLKGIFAKHHKRQILDMSTEYFWENIARITAEDYIPNKVDIINIRNRTTGIIEKKFEYKTIGFHIFDVGGQKSERKKWMNCFDNVKAIVFVVALSPYNQVMFEDQSKNYMTDALELFDKTINDAHFSNTAIILFLNKKDLFRTKISDLPITECPAFSDFDSENGDPNDFEQTTNFIKMKFEQINKQNRKIYTHLTCAMDDKNIENVFADIAQIIINQIKDAMSMQNIL